MALNMGIMTVMSLSPNLQALMKGLLVGKKIFDVIDREPEIKDHE